MGAVCCLCSVVLRLCRTQSDLCSQDVTKPMSFDHDQVKGRLLYLERE